MTKLATVSKKGWFFIILIDLPQTDPPCHRVSGAAGACRNIPFNMNMIIFPQIPATLLNPHRNVWQILSDINKWSVTNKRLFVQVKCFGAFDWKKNATRSEFGWIGSKVESIRAVLDSKIFSFGVRAFVFC